MLKVSIIIPIYNGEKYLKECIESAINQTISSKEYEIILVNDGSKDDSLTIAQYYANIHSNIVIIDKEKNKGEVDSCNIGIEKAKGKYIYILHDDDIASKNLIEYCYELAEEYNLDAVHFGWDTLLNTKVNYRNHNIENGDKCYCNLKIEDKLMNGKEFFEVYGWVGPLFTYFLKKDFFIANNLFFEDSVLDLYNIFKLNMKLKKVIHVNRSLYIRRLHDSNFSNNYFVSKGFYYRLVITLYKYLDLIDCCKLKNDFKFIQALKRYFFTIFFSLLKNIKGCNGFNNEREMENHINDFLKKYIKVFGQELEIFESQMLVEIQADYRNIMNNYGGASRIDTKVGDLFSMSHEKIEKYKKELLLKIPFENSEKKIVVYGIGNHTINLFKYYEKNISTIKAKIFYLDTFKGKKGEAFNGEKVINIDDINYFDFDCIVISSASYEEQLFLNLKKVLNREVQIYRFYENSNCTLF